MILSYAFWSFLENKKCKEKPEILLTKLLLYLLQNYDEPKEAIKRLTGLNVEYFEKEKQEKVHTSKEEKDEEEKILRPDIIGYDKNGKKLLIIECKLDSGLTENQPNSYLKSIEEGGKLIFLVPKDRIEYIRNKIEERVARENLERIKILSWMELIEKIKEEAESKKNKNLNLLADLKQIKDLIIKLDRETMRPLTQDDLDPKNGKLIVNFLKILKKCRDRIGRELKDEISMKGLSWGCYSDTGDIGFYFRFKQKDIGGYLHISFEKWAKYKSVETPFWIRLNKFDERNKPIGKHELAHSKLKDKEKSKTFEDFVTKKKNERGTLYAITLTPGMEEEEIVNHIVNEIKKLANYFKEIG